MKNLYIFTSILLWSISLTGHALPLNTPDAEEAAKADASEQGPEFKPIMPTVPRPKPIQPEPMPRHQIQAQDYALASEIELVDIELALPDFAEIDTTQAAYSRAHLHKPAPLCIYSLPYSTTLNVPDWKRLWTNTAVLGGAYVAAMGVLECLPEGSTNWNKKEIQSVPFYKRWWRHVVKEGPEWDGDSWIFNYILHPYAGAVYFMAARSNGFNFYRSLLYSACVSTIGWEFGVEGIMERPSLQDLFITPIVGSLMGEGFYRIKRHIVSHGYELFGSPVLGNIVVYLIDPVNEVIGLFNGNPARRYASSLQPNITLQPSITANHFGFSLLASF